MPTGYTAELCEKEQSFEDFVLTCGACVTQRDESLNEKPKFKEDKYYQDKLIESFDKYDTIQNKSEKECFDEEVRAAQESIKTYKKAIQERKGVRKRLEEMREKVVNWDAPTKEHIGLKNFMIEQINSTIDFDGNWSYYEEAIERAETRIKELTPEKAKKNLIDSLEKDIERYKGEAEKEIKRNNERRDWITNLYKSLNLEI